MYPSTRADNIIYEVSAMKHKRRLEILDILERIYCLISTCSARTSNFDKMLGTASLADWNYLYGQNSKIQRRHGNCKEENIQDYNLYRNSYQCNCIVIYGIADSDQRNRLYIEAETSSKVIFIRVATNVA